MSTSPCAWAFLKPDGWPHEALERGGGGEGGAGGCQVQHGLGSNSSFETMYYILVPRPLLRRLRAMEERYKIERGEWGGRRWGGEKCHIHSVQGSQLRMHFPVPIIVQILNYYEY